SSKGSARGARRRPGASGGRQSVLPTAAAGPDDLGWGIMTSTATEAPPGVGGVAGAGGTDKDERPDRPALFGAPSEPDVAGRAPANKSAHDKQDRDPYITGPDETVLLDLRELRSREAAERAARDQA